MVELTIRTYKASEVVGVSPGANLYSLPGSMHDKINSRFLVNHAGRICSSLDIPYIIQIPRRHSTRRPTEILIAMDEHQYALWKIAGGDHYCEMNRDNGMTAVRLDNPASVETEVRQALDDTWVTKFLDGMVSFVRGDCVISVYPDGLIRGLQWRRYYNFFIPDGSINVRTALRVFPFMNDTR